jgi:uncharacterized protein YuzE
MKEEKAVVTYDFQNDILYMSAKQREYEFSEEVDELVIDLDKNKKIIGLEIFDASEKFNIDKVKLQNLKGSKWLFEADKKKLYIKISLTIILRNKEILPNYVYSGINDFFDSPFKQGLAVT